MDDTVFVSMMQGFRYGLADQGDGDSQSMGRTGTVGLHAVGKRTARKIDARVNRTLDFRFGSSRRRFLRSLRNRRASGNGLFDKASRLANQAIEVLPLDIRIVK